MAASSNKNGDIAIWIERVIDSCTHPLQEITARKLIQQFEKRLLDEQNEFYTFYTRKLRDKLDLKTYTSANANLN